jgi:hypothetical protein
MDREKCCTLGKSRKSFIRITMLRFREFAKNYWPYFYTTAAPLILFAPFLLGRVFLYWGTPYFQFYPWRKLAFDLIRAGQIPLWNPFLGNGTPLIANYQSAIFYPPNWLGLILPTEYAFSWLVVLHLIWAGAGMITFARAFGLKPFGQVIAGLAFGMSQFLVAKAADSARADALAWLPWILWAADRALFSEKKFNKYIFYFSLFAALQLLAGHAQTTWYTYLLLAAWTLYRALSSKINFGRLALLATALILSAGIAAIQLMPTAEFLLHSQRSSEYGYDAAMVYSYAPARLVTLLAPDFFGNPARNSFFGYGLYYEDAGYIGILPIVLVLGFLFSRIKLPRRSPPPADTDKLNFPNSIILFLVGTMIVSFILGLGSNTPIFPFLYRHVPTFNMFQAPTRIMVWFAFSLALLAGLAADNWTPPQDKKLYWTRLGLMGAITIMLFGAALYFMLPTAGKINGQIHTMAGASALAGFLLTISVIFALAQPAPNSPRRALWIYLVAGFVALDVIYANIGINPPGPAALYAPTAQTTTVSEHRVFERGVDFTHFLNFQTFGSPALAMNARALDLTDINVINDVSSLNNYDPLKEYRFAKLLNALYNKNPDRVLQLADVGTIITGPNSAALSLNAVDWKPSRVWVVNSAQIVADENAALDAIFANNFDPAQNIILEENDPGTAAAHSVPYETASSSSAPEIISSQANDVKISASLSQNGWLVLSDTYYPGWYVFVDGTPAKLLHADYAFRGVAVPAGNHIIEFRYEPFSVTLGAWTTFISALIFAGLFWKLKH